MIRGESLALIMSSPSRSSGLRLDLERFGAPCMESLSIVLFLQQKGKISPNIHSHSPGKHALLSSSFNLMA